MGSPVKGRQPKRRKFEDFKWWYEDTFTKGRTSWIQSQDETNPQPPDDGSVEEPPAYGVPGLTISCASSF